MYPTSHLRHKTFLNQNLRQVFILTIIGIEFVNLSVSHAGRFGPLQHLIEMISQDASNLANGVDRSVAYSLERTVLHDLDSNPTRFSGILNIGENSGDVFLELPVKLTVTATDDLRLETVVFAQFNSVAKISARGEAGIIRIAIEREAAVEFATEISSLPVSAFDDLPEFIQNFAIKGLDTRSIGFLSKSRSPKVRFKLQNLLTESLLRDVSESVREYDPYFRRSPVLVTDTTNPRVESIWLGVANESEVSIAEYMHQLMLRLVGGQ